VPTDLLFGLGGMMPILRGGWSLAAMRWCMPPDNLIDNQVAMRLSSRVHAS
jgi:hypothetical protein